MGDHMPPRVGGLFLLRLGTASKQSKIVAKALKNKFGIEDLSRVYAPDIKIVNYQSHSRHPVVILIDEDWATGFNSNVTDASEGTNAFAILPYSEQVADMTSLHSSLAVGSRLESERLARAPEELDDAIGKETPDGVQVRKHSLVAAYLPNPGVEDETDDAFVLVDPDDLEVAVTSCLLMGGPVNLDHGISIWTHALGAGEVKAPVYVWLNISCVVLPDSNHTSEVEDPQADREFVPTTTRAAQVQEIHSDAGTGDDDSGFLRSSMVLARPSSPTQGKPETDASARASTSEISEGSSSSSSEQSDSSTGSSRSHGSVASGSMRPDRDDTPHAPSQSIFMQGTQTLPIAAEQVTATIRPNTASAPVQTVPEVHAKPSAPVHVANQNTLDL